MQNSYDILFNETCIDDGLLPIYIYIYINIYIHKYISIYIFYISSVVPHAIANSVLCLKGEEEGCCKGLDVINTGDKVLRVVQVIAVSPDDHEPDKSEHQPAVGKVSCYRVC